MRTTAKQLNYLVEEIAQLTGLAMSQEQAIEKGLGSYLYLEYASCYGGYRLISVGLKSGAHYGALGGSSTEPRLKASEMETKLRGIIYGLEYAKKH